MCGLVGFFGTTTATIKAAAPFRWMLYIDALRGEDSTGVALRRIKKNSGRSSMTILKAPGLPQNLWRKHPEFFSADGKLVANPNEFINLAIGHNRAATVGGVNLINAHPFHHGHITGAHNGTISAGLHKLPKDGMKGQTDSEQMYLALSKGWSLQEVLDAVTGAIAFTWWDSDHKTMNLYRNDQRPLWIVEDLAGDSILWASEKGFLEIAMGKTKTKGQYKEPVQLPVDEHYQYSINQQGRMVLSKTPIISKKTDDNYGYTFGYQKQYPYSVPATTPVTPASSTLLAQANRTPAPGFLARDPKTGWLDSTPLTDKQFMDMTADGCALCDMVILRSDRPNTFFLEEHTPLCKACASKFHH